MSPNTTISLSLLCSFVTMIGCIVTIYGVFRTKTKDNTAKELNIEKNFVKINMKLDEFCRNISDLVKKADASATTMSEVQRTLVAVDGRLSNHDHVLDTHEMRLRELEEKFSDME